VKTFVNKFCLKETGSPEIGISAFCWTSPTPGEFAFIGALPVVVVESLQPTKTALAAAATNKRESFFSMGLSKARHTPNKKRINLKI
jgi:hypothetical protein